MDAHFDSMREWENTTITFQGEEFDIYDFCERPLVPEVFQPRSPTETTRKGILSAAYQQLTVCLAADTVDFPVLYAGVLRTYTHLPPVFAPLAPGWGISEFPCSRASVMDCFREGEEVDYNEDLRELGNVAGAVLSAVQTTFGALAETLGQTPLDPSSPLNNVNALTRGSSLCWMITVTPSSTQCMIDSNAALAPLSQRQFVFARIVEPSVKNIFPTLNNSFVTAGFPGRCRGHR